MEECGAPMSCLVILMFTSLRVCGECSAASTRDAGCTEEELEAEDIEEDDEQALPGDEEEDMAGLRRGCSQKRREPPGFNI